MSDPLYNYRQVLTRVYDKIKIALRVTNVDDFFQQIALGKVAGASRFTLIGHNPDQRTSDGLIEITNLGVPFPYKTVDAKVTIVSDSANDTLLGTGLRKLSISGVNTAYDLVEEVVDMDGVNGFQTVNDYIFFNIMFGDEAGSLQVNDGTITATHTTDVIAKIEPERGRSHHGIVYVPLNRVVLVEKLFAHMIKREGSTGIKEGTLFFQAKSFGKSFVTTTPAGIRSDGAPFLDQLKVAILIDEKSIIRVIGQVDANNTATVAKVDLTVLEKDLIP